MRCFGLVLVGSVRFGLHHLALCIAILVEVSIRWYKRGKNEFTITDIMLPRRSFPVPKIRAMRDSMTYLSGRDQQEMMTTTFPRMYTRSGRQVEDAPTQPLVPMGCAEAGCDRRLRFALKGNKKPAYCARHR